VATGNAFVVEQKGGVVASAENGLVRVKFVHGPGMLARNDDKAGGPGFLFLCPEGGQGAFVYGSGFIC
jgi:hypothetical protein